MMAVYAPERQLAPLVLGHPSDNQPGFGEVNVLVEKNGNLYAQAAVSDSLVTLVRAGRYRYVSAAFYPPYAPNNPRPDSYYLRHVGFLGAMPPAIKGMTPPEFSERCGGFLNFCEGYPVNVHNSLNFSESAYPDRLPMTESERLAAEFRQDCSGLSYSEANYLACYALNL